MWWMPWWTGFIGIIFDRLHSTLGYCTSVEFDEIYHDEMSGSLPDDDARKMAA